jgi:mono/diheme cytochrome c family protein
MNPTPRFLVLAALVGLAAVSHAQTPVPRDAAAIYTQLCASCHGAELQGGAGSSLIDDIWKYGADDQSLATSIQQGRLDSGMPAFGEVLDAAQTRALIVYIREIGVRSAERTNPLTPPKPGAVVATATHSFRLEEVASGSACRGRSPFSPKTAYS